MSTEHDLSGVHVALTTPFDPRSGDVDHDALERHATWLLDNGIDGLVPNGSLGEYESLAPDERRAVVGTVARVTHGRAKLIVGVSAPNYRIAAEHARHAASVGADGVMLLPPTNHAPTAAELFSHGHRDIEEIQLSICLVLLAPEGFDDNATIARIGRIKVWGTPSLQVV